MPAPCGGGGGLDVALVIPAFNAERFLRRAVESALGQSCPPGEIIVVDDGSRDGTVALAESFGSPVRCIRQANAGPAAARNRGIAEATAEWVAFLDADDAWYPSKLERQAEVVRAWPDLVWLACGFHLRRERAMLRAAFDVGPTGRDGAPQRLGFFAATALGLNIQTTGVLVRRQVLESLGRFDPALRRGEDLDLWWRIAIAHRDIGYVAEPLYCYDVAVNPQDGRTNIPGKLRLLALTLERARRHSTEAESAFLGFARGHVLLRVAMIAARRLDFPPEELGRYMDTFRVPAWQRTALTLLRHIPRRAANVLEQMLYRRLHPVKMVPCQENECACLKPDLTS